MNGIKDQDLIEFVTVTVDGVLFGIPIARVQDVFLPDRLTPVPQAPQEIAGVLNLRGRIVTAIDMRRRLSLPVREGGRPMAIGIESRAESYGLLIDTVGEVLKLPADARQPNPINLDVGLARVSSGIYRLDGQLMVVLDIDRVLDIGSGAIAA